MKASALRKDLRGKQAMTPIHVHVEFSSMFQSLCPSPHPMIELQEQEATVEGLLRWLSGKYGERMRNLLFERGTMSILPGLMIVVNGRIHTGGVLSARDVPLKEGDRVSLLYFMSGG
jgi:molybdopterin converting factor small subunit